MLIYLTFIFFKKNYFSFPICIFWILIWLICLLLTLRVEYIDNYLSLYLIKGNIRDYLISMSIFFLLMISFSNFVKTQILKKQISEITKNIAKENFSNFES